MESFWLTKMRNADAGTTINRAAAMKLPIMPTAELLAASGETFADRSNWENWSTFYKINSQFIIRIKAILMGYLLRWIKQLWFHWL